MSSSTKTSMQQPHSTDPRKAAQRSSAGAFDAEAGNQPPDTEKIFLTIEELAAKLTLSVGCLRAWRARGEGPPAIRFGNRLRWDRREIDAWIDANRESKLSEGHRDGC
jgi:predicted DNA-binding transcriptional regulator AlpA